MLAAVFRPPRQVLLSMYHPLNVYRQVDIKARVASATPPELVVMLLEGALTAVVEAKGHMAHRRILERGTAISKATSILAALSENLNMETGGLVAQRLRGLYNHMIWRLHLAHLKNDAAILDEAGNQLVALKGTWTSVGAPSRQP